MEKMPHWADVVLIPLNSLTLAASLSALVILINFCIDVLYAWIDPRLKAGHAK